MGQRSSFFILGVLSGGLLVSLLLAFVITSGEADSRESVRILKLGHTLDRTHPVHEGMLYMKKRLEELSGGQMSLEIYPSSQLGGETQMMEMLQSGELALTKTSAAPMEGFVPEMGVFGLPYVFRDRDHFWKVLDGDIGRDLLGKGVSKNLKGLCYYDAGSRNFYSIDRTITKPADLKGLKIRVMNSQMAIQMVSAMGGAPTPIAWGELYSALQQGIVDGAENNPPSFVTNKHYEVCKHFSLDAHTRIPDMLMASAPIYDKLSPREQEWLQKAAQESSVFQRTLWQTKSDAALKEMEEEHGVKVVKVDGAAFRDSVKSMVLGHKGTPVGDYFNLISEVK
ncbi:MAG: TRAP transporter substrate-binding protein [Planctomycetes bacterium]|nr:TRAP transporter substrate-binding protein [Planctomycetota bacterium]